MLIEESGCEPKVVEIGDDLDSWYKALDCNLVQTVYRSIGGKEFCLICDEEGLFAERLPVAITLDGDKIIEMLVGSILIAGLPDAEGNNTDLSDEDVKHILKTSNYRTLMLQRHDIPYLRRMLQIKVA